MLASSNRFALIIITNCPSIYVVAIILIISSLFFFQMFKLADECNKEISIEDALTPTSHRSGSGIDLMDDFFVISQ
jgi:hypothetical protein